MQIHYQLATLKKGNSSIADYFHQFKTLVDILAATAQPLNDFELVSFLLASLGSNYDSFVTSMITRVDPLSIKEPYGHLLAHELRLEHQQPIVDLSIAGANFAGRGNSLGGCGGGHSSLSSGLGSPSLNQKNNKGWGHGCGNTNSSTCLVCQVCNKTGY